MEHVLSSKKLQSRLEKNIKAMIINNDEINAFATASSPDQYLIGVNTGLLNATYNFLAPLAQGYYERHADEIKDVSCPQFLRIALGSAGMTVFWHEFAHIFRGHLAYLDAQTKNSFTTLNESEILNIDAILNNESLSGRLLEIDADIWAAQFQLAQMSVVARSTNQFTLATYSKAYAIGMRGLYEVLNEGSGQHDDAPHSTHPHPISRAYIAIAHGLARLNSEGFSVDEAKIVLQTTETALLQFEAESLGMPVDPSILNRFMETELKQWGELESVLTAYQVKRK